MDDKELLKKYKVPIKKNPEFSRYWKKFLPGVAKRENFQEFHLKNLEVLCTLYIEYDNLTQTIQEEGFSYIAEGRYGVQRKTLPEVTERTKILAEIRQYSRLLGIVLTKDVSQNPNDQENDWTE
jgi:phage terminase small subunit